jgi:hypothetical protein
MMIEHDKEKCKDYIEWLKKGKNKPVRGKDMRKIDKHWEEVHRGR